MALTIPLHIAAFNGNLTDLKECIASGDDINSFETYKNKDGDEILFVTPLYLAAMEGHYEVCVMLLANGADPNIKTFIPRTRTSFTIRDIALTHFHLKIYKLLTNPTNTKPKRNDMLEPLIN